MVRKNRFTKALIHLKSTELDEKIQSLKEGPTNKTTGVYSLGKKGVSLSPYEPPKKFFPDKDGNWPEGVPGVPGEGVYVRPGGFWDGGRDWDSVQESDFSYNNMVDTNNNTTTEGLISPGGFVQTALPPNSRHFILGPLVDSYTYNHGYDSYTTIGYLQKDTRQFVALGRIWGQWKAGLHGSLDRPNRVWDPTNASVFESYNPEFTLEMAQWVSAEANADRFYSDVPYFYSGGVMQSIPTWGMNFGNLWPTIGGLFGNMFGGLGFGGGGNGGSASTATPGGAGFGSGDPSVVTTGQQLDGDDPSNHGNSGDNGLWGGLGDLWNDIKDAAANVWDQMTEVGQSISDQWNQNLQDTLEYHNKPLGDRLLDDVKSALNAVGFTVGVVQGSAITMGTYLNANLINTTTSDEAFLNGGLPPYIGVSDSSTQHGANLALSLMSSMATGQTVAINNSNIGPNLLNELGSTLTTDDINVILSGHFHEKPPQSLPDDPDSILNNVYGDGTNPDDKNDYRDGGIAGEGGTIIRPGLDANGYPVLYETSDKNVRITEEAGGGFDLSSLQYADVPQPSNASLQSMVDKVLDSGIYDHVVTMAIVINDRFNNPSASWSGNMGPTGDPFDGGFGGINPNLVGNQMTYDQAYEQAIDIVHNQQGYRDILHSWITNPIISHGLTSVAGGNVNGTVAGATTTSAILDAFGLKPTSALEQAGAAGHVRRETTIPIHTLSPQVQAIYYQYLNDNNIQYSTNSSSYPSITSESHQLSEERKIQILKEIKKPVLIEATPMKKLSGYKPKFKSKSKTPPTKPQSAEQLVASGNAKGQSWREEDKHWQGYETTERLNIIRHQVGHGEAAWNQIIEDARVKNGWKNREMQEQLNIISHERALKGIDPDFESPFNLKEWQNNEDPNRDEINIISKDPLVKQVKNRILSQIDYKDKPSRKGYPDGEPPKLGRDGFHPDLGRKKSAYYKRLDSVSALAMPKQGDEEIDAEVDKQKKKYVNPKVAESWKSDWRDSLTNA